MRLQSAAVFTLAMVPVMAAAQQFMPRLPGPPVDPNTRFEVTSVKAYAPGVNTFMRMQPGGQFESNLPVGLVLRQALQKADYQIVGAPDWIDTERYTIVAKAPEGTPLSATSVLLLNLLKDRFQLATRLETRELPVFNLVVARADGRLGPDLKPTPAECQAIVAERNASLTTAAAGRGAPPPMPPLGDPNGPPPCGMVRQGIGQLAGSARTIADLVPTLSDWLARPVIDKTGLSGMHDFTLTFAPDSVRLPGILRLLGTAPPPPPVDSTAPSLSVALQEQLGLKIESSRGPVEVVVIDRIERPTLD
jgi:uncharacterized protein (TIGR03435 family)